MKTFTDFIKLSGFILCAVFYIGSASAFLPVKKSLNLQYHGVSQNALAVERQSVSMHNHNRYIWFSAGMQRESFKDLFQEDYAYLNAGPRFHWSSASIEVGPGVLYNKISLKNFHDSSARLKNITPTFRFAFYLKMFKASVLVNEESTVARAAYLFRFIKPIELNLQYQSLPFSQQSLWVKSHVYLSRGYGFGLGYEPLAETFSTSGFLSVNHQSLISLEYRLQTVAESSGSAGSVQVSFQYRFVDKKNMKPVRVSLESGVKNKTESAKKKKTKKQFKRKKIAPPFHTMLRWGVSPTQAYRIQQAKDVCAGNAAARVLLARHNWRCYMR